MSVISKHFYDITASKTCQDIIHPWTPNCFDAVKWTFLNTLSSNLKFFFPLIFLPMIAGSKSKNRKEVLESMISFGKIALHAYISTSIVIYLICFVYKTFGRFYYPIFMFAPAFLGSLTINALPHKQARYHSNAIFSMVVETILKSTSSQTMRALKKSKIVGTLSFSAFSSILLYVLRKKDSSVFWVLQPPKFDKIPEEKSISSFYVDQIIKCENRVCPHEGSCDHFISTGILTYGKYGLIIDILTNIFSNISTLKSNPTGTIKSIFSDFNLRFFKFLVLYSGLYKISSCLINRYNKEDTKKGTLIAGFIGGLSYYFSPSYHFFTTAFTTAAELSWVTYCESKKFKKPEVINKVNKYPIGNIIYMFSVGYLLHMRITHPEFIAKFALKFIDMLSGKRALEITEKLQSMATPYKL